MDLNKLLRPSSIAVIGANDKNGFGKSTCTNLLHSPLQEHIYFVNPNRTELFGKKCYAFPHENAIAFIGTKDPWSNTEEVVRLSKQQKVPIYVYEEANHSIETPDTMKNLELLTDVMEKTKRYIHLFEIIQ